METEVNTVEEIKLATAKKAKAAPKGKLSGKATKVTKTAKVVKKTPVPAVKTKVVTKTRAATKVAAKAAKSKAKPAPKAVAKSTKVPKAVAKGQKAKPTPKATAKSITVTKAVAKGQKAKSATKAVASKAAPPKPTKAPPKLTSKNAPPKSAAPNAVAKTHTAPTKAATPVAISKTSKAPVSVLAADEKPKTPVGKQPPRPTLMTAEPAAPTVTIPVPTRALPKSMTVKAAVSTVLPFNPKTTGVEGYLSEAEILKQPKEKYMSKEQLAFFKQRLVELQAQLRENAGQTTEHLRELAIVPDPADRATLEEEHALELRARDRERKLLKKVEAAILRIDEGEYGYCEETGEPIGIPRLLARPTATLSIEAQERRELKQRMFGE